MDATDRLIKIEDMGLRASLGGPCVQVDGIIELVGAPANCFTGAIHELSEWGNRRLIATAASLILRWRLRQRP